MPRYNDILHSFLNGEVSPRLYGRTDSETYKRSCRTLQNMLVMPQGGVKRRLGSEYVEHEFPVALADTAPVSITAGARVIPFQVSRTESYLVVLPGRLLPDGSEPDRVAVHVYHVQTGTWRTVTHLIFAGPSHNTYNTLFADPDFLKDIQYAQTNDLLVMVHKDAPPLTLFRTGVGQFKLNTFWMNAVTGGLRGAGGGGTPNDNSFRCFPYLESLPNAINITSSAVTGSAVNLTTTTNFFSASHVGTIFAFQDGGTVGYARISAFATAQSVTADVLSSLPAAATSGMKTWRESAWSDLRGYPRAVTFFDGRIIFGGTRADPDTLWASKLFNIYEMSNKAILDPASDVTASDPVVAELFANEANEIQWLRGGNVLLVGTRGREYSVSDISPEGTRVKPQTSQGSEYVQPVVVEESPVYVQRGFRKLRRMQFDYRIEGYTADDLSLLAEHLPRIDFATGAATQNEIKRLAFQQLNNTVLWALRTDGSLIASTLSRETNSNAWHRHILGGDVTVLDIAAVGDRQGHSDDLYIIASRYGRIQIEKIQSDFFHDTLYEENSFQENEIPIFLDGAEVFEKPSLTPDFFASFRSSKDADIAGGSATGTTSGTVTQETYGLRLDASAHVTFEGSDNFNTVFSGGFGCIRLEVQLLNTANGTIFDLGFETGATSPINWINLAVVNSNQLTLSAKDSSGTLFLNAVNLGSTAKPSKLLIELNYDFILGETRLFINGRQLGATLTSLGDRSTAIGYFRLGANHNGADGAVAMIVRDLAFFRAPQHTSEYKPSRLCLFGNDVKYLNAPENTVLSVFADGNYKGEFTVNSANTITLTDSFNTVVVGHKYRHILETNALEAGSAVGSSQGSIKRVDRLVVRMEQSAQLEYGPTQDNLIEEVMRESGNLGNPISLFTGDRVLDLDGDYDRNARIVISGEAPLPCNITCLIARGLTYD